MRVADVMNRQAARLRIDDPLRIAAEMLALTQSSDIAVVEEDGTFVGVLSEGDLLRALMPDYSLLEDGPVSVADATAFFAESGISRAEDPVGPLVITQSLTVEPDDDLLRPAAAMVTRQIRSLPVLQDGRFVATLSRADVCWALLIDAPGHRRPR